MSYTLGIDKLELIIKRKSLLSIITNNLLNPFLESISQRNQLPHSI
jgi:hypothetical protein